jgi:Bacterial regulatory proteins, tetR family
MTLVASREHPDQRLGIPNLGEPKDSGPVPEQGVDSVTTDAVASAAGVGKGTLFRRFSDRSGVLRALMDERERAFQDSFIRGPAPLGPGASPRERS